MVCITQYRESNMVLNWALDLYSVRYMTMENEKITKRITMNRVIASVVLFFMTGFIPGNKWLWYVILINLLIIIKKEKGLGKM